MEYAFVLDTDVAPALEIDCGSPARNTVIKFTDVKFQGCFRGPWDRVICDCRVTASIFMTSLLYTRIPATTVAAEGTRT